MGAFVVSRSDIPFFVGLRGKLGVALSCGRPTLGAASPMKPRGSFSFACSGVIPPAFCCVPEGEGDRCAGLRAKTAQVPRTSAKASRCSPDARLGRGAKRWDDEGSVLKTGDRRGNLPLCFAGTHGSDECLPLGWLDVARYCEFCGTVCRQRRVCDGEDRRRIATARAVREAARSDFSKTRQKVIFCKLQFSK